MTDLELAGLRLPAGTRRTDFRARMNWGRWIVDCAACTSALYLEPSIADQDIRVVGCWDCGAPMGPIIWPENHLDIVAILGWRPDPNTRNWEPGESLEDLLGENAAHGILPPDWAFPEVAPGGPSVALSVSGDWITGGVCAPALLAAAGRYRQQVGQVRRREIGA